jgi:coproporphyrinogen III oxidase
MRYNLQESLDSVILNVGDIIIDTFSGYTGMLVKREHRIDMMDDDLYFWEVKWMTNVERDDLKFNHTRIRLGNTLEEEGIKLSIVVGAMKWHSINGGTFEL